MTETQLANMARQAQAATGIDIRAVADRGYFSGEEILACEHDKCRERADPASLASCRACDLKARCTTSLNRWITRWEHEAALDAMQRRLDGEPDAMRTRRQTVEHVFGTIKAWMGSTHFLTRRIGNVATEMSLHILAYYLKRVVAILGAGPLIAAISA